MIVDRRKDSYDELLVLARDSHISRKRTNRWTTGLIISAMAASTVYVATINAEMDALEEATEAARTQQIDLSLRLQIAERDRDIYRGQRDVFQENASWFVDLEAADSIGDSINNIGNNFPREGDPRVVQRTNLANVVWVVNGSRRFPMTDNDILWIPESNLWVRLEEASPQDPDDPRRDGNYRRISLHHDALPAGPTSPGRIEHIGGPYRYFEEEGRWADGAYGNANCLKLTLHYQSSRPAFAGNPDYIDMEVLLYNSEGGCPDPGHIVDIPPPAE